MEALEELAPVLGLGTRTLHDHAIGKVPGKILGCAVICENGMFRICVESDDPGFHGPVSDQLDYYLVPVGTLSVSYEPISGIVSSQVFQGNLKSTEKKAMVEYMSPLSGMDIRLVPNPLVNKADRRGD